MDADDRTKTGCLGILLPLAVAAYGAYRIVHPREVNRFTGQPYEGNAVVGLGVSAIGLAVFCHAFGFIPYRRIAGLRWVVAALGVTIFFLGLFWREIRA